MPPQTHPRALRAACMLASASARCMHANQRVRANVAPAVRRDAARTFSAGRTRPAIRARSALSAVAHACMQTHPHSLCMRACSAQLRVACMPTRPCALCAVLHKLLAVLLWACYHAALPAVSMLLSIFARCTTWSVSMYSLSLCLTLCFS